MAVRRDTPEQDLLKILKPEIEARQIVVFANSDQYFRALSLAPKLIGQKFFVPAKKRLTTINLKCLFWASLIKRLKL
jgi:hypothetical protein